MDRRNFLKASGWTLLGLAAAETIPGCAKLGDRDSLPGDLKKGFPSLKDLKVFWGDVHNHCNVTYGHGDLSDALAAAEQQLDFVSVTPHALWPDIPGENDPRLNWVIGYHTEAFRRLRAGGYDKYLAAVRAANRPGEFLTFPSYECQSTAITWRCSTASTPRWSSAPRFPTSRRGSKSTTATLRPTTWAI